MSRRRNRRLLFAAILAAAPGCRLDTSAMMAPGTPLLNLDVAASQYNANFPSPPRPVEQPDGEKKLEDRLAIPRELPGAEAPPFNLPPRDPNQTPAEREKSIAALFGTVTPLPGDPVPTGKPLELDALQREATANHPVIRQAMAAVESARGLALQAGLPPNPALGYEADTIASGATAGQQGVKLEQLVKTAGKLKLAQAAATMDVVNAEVALRKAQIDLATQVRAAYFAALVAEEQLRVTYGLCRLNDEAYRIMVDLAKSGQLAMYEPLQIRALAAQARATRAQAEFRYRAAWRTLAAAVNRPDLPPAPLVGAAAETVPCISYELARDAMLARHTDLRTAANGVLKAQYQLKLAQVTPVPDVAFKVVVQKDYTTPPFATSTNLEVGAPIPIWDRNQGNIRHSEAELAKSIEEISRVRLELLTKLADANERYLSNRVLVETTLTQVLPDLVKAYRGLIDRYQTEPEKVTFNDVLVAQGNISQALTSYLGYLSDQWKALVDFAAIAQCEDLNEFNNSSCPVPKPVW